MGNGFDDAWYRSIVEESPDGIWVFDLEGRTIYANAAIAGLVGKAAITLSAQAVLSGIRVQADSRAA